MDSVTRFIDLFRGNERAHGLCKPLHGGKYRQWTKHEAPVRSDFEKHLSGEIGIGTKMLLPDDSCVWGAIDVDIYDDGPSVDLVYIESKIKKHFLPLTVCGSKSGGAHLYIFFSCPVSHTKCIDILKSYAYILFPENSTKFLPFEAETEGTIRKIKLIEIFPHPKSGDVNALPSSLNLPYFNDKNTDRYCIEGGKQIEFDYFLDICENRRIDGNQIQTINRNLHPDAPPCIQSLLRDGTATNRNESLFNIGVYFKKAYPQIWRDRSLEANHTVFSPPLNEYEAQNVINSVGKKLWRYRCQTEPCKSLCDSKTCLTRKHGITQEDELDINLFKMPKFSNLKKYLTEPPTYELQVDDKKIRVPAHDLLSPKLMEEHILDSVNKLVPSMKPNDWKKIIMPLLEAAEIIATPDEAGPEGQIRSKAVEFMKKAELGAAAQPPSSVNLISGQPVLIEYANQKHVVFKGVDFVKFLKYERAEELKGGRLWLALEKMGFAEIEINTRTEKSINVWAIELNPVWVFEPDGLEFTEEF